VALVTDAWKPQVNGVARTLATLQDMLTTAGHEVAALTPDLFRTVPCPTQPEVRLAFYPRPGIARRLEVLAPDVIHISTEGPLGLAARAYCLEHGLRFTTAYHTKFPEYLQARFGIPLSLGYAWLRRFHAKSSTVMVATETVRRELGMRGFARVVTWTRGVDTALFRPGRTRALDLPRPVFLYVGRVAAEKSLPAFLDLDLPGSKLVVGDGHLLPEMMRRYPAVCFAGRREGEALVRHYASADVFVLPSRTETFGLVMLEALACGLPVAALPVPGPLDVVGDSGAGVLDWDLRAAALRALTIPRETCLAHASHFGWRASMEQFLGYTVPAVPPAGALSGRTAFGRAAVKASAGDAMLGPGTRRWAGGRSGPDGR
jgi:glycosyltransferase involved in cell wall biosynthesis